MTGMDELKAALSKKNVVIGFDRTVKLLKAGKAKKVFLACNASDEMKDDIKYYSSFKQVEVVELEATNTDLGTACKKPFSVAVIGVKNEN